MKTFYDLSYPKLDGAILDFADLKGKVVLVVNTASKCGFTPQLTALEKIYKDFHSQGFEIIAFPSNQFGGQEPLNENEIGAFCEKNYGTSFTIMQKSDVKGPDTNEVFQFLSNKKNNGTLNSKPKWNFHKYLIDKEGKVVDYFYSSTSPDAKRVISKIEKLLH